MKLNQMIFKTAVVAIAAMAVFGCKEKEETLPALNEGLVLAVDVDDVTYTSAKIKVTHNGAKEDTWYGLLTTDVKTDEGALIASAAAAYKAGDEALHKSRSYVTILQDLEEGKAYRYIAFGLSEDGRVYGTSASVEFQTKGSSGGGDEPVDGMSVNPAWTVNYVGAGVIGDQDFDHVITVNSTDRNTYAITVVYADLWDVNDLRDMAELFVDNLKNTVAEWNSYYGTSTTLADWLYTGSASDAFDLDPDYYKAVAIGITPAGEVSGLYAVSEVFEVVEPIATEDYNAWLGDWTVVGENGVEFDITLSKHLANKSFWMSGWEGFEDLPVDVEYSKQRNDLTFYAQKVAEDYYLKSLDAEVDMYFLGSDDEGQFYDIKDGMYYIAIAGVLDGGQRALVRYGVNLPYYPKFSAMSYAAELDGKYYFFTDDEDLPTFRGIAAIDPAGKSFNAPAARSVRTGDVIASESLLRCVPGSPGHIR